MLRSTKRRLWFVLTSLGLLLAVSVLAACTVSVSGGITGVIGSLALGAALLGLGASTSGCDDSVGACLTVDVGACLSQALDVGIDGAPAEVGPCLSQALPDAGVDAVTPDAATPDAHVGPCLSPPLPDTGLDTGNLDAGKPDTKVGPCLSPPPLPLGALEPDPLRHPAPAPMESRENQRALAIARLSARLPPDVAERLGEPGDDETA
jgi:hypothetical protein